MPVDPIGYLELQDAWTSMGPQHEDQEAEEHLRELDAKAARTYGGPVERVRTSYVSRTDQYGKHALVVAGYAPEVERAPPLDPRNLNGTAPVNQLGMGELGMGTKEQRF